MSRIDNKTILLIAGQPKAGTTSLFEWLAQHPQVAAGKLKELRFFLDDEYPLETPMRFDGSNFGNYISLFQNSDRKVLLDASPDYIGCQTPLCLPQLHPNSKAVLVFRNPIDRLVSAFKFYRSMGLLPKTMQFDEYVAKQAEEGVNSTTPSEYRVLDHCRRDYYIDKWSNSFGENLLVVNFDELQNNPKKILARICQFAGISHQFSVELEQKNVTRNYRFPYLYRVYNSARRKFAHTTLRAPIIYKILRPLARKFFWVFKIEAKGGLKICISEATRNTIAQISGIE